MNVAGLIYVLAAHFLCGKAVLRAFKLQLSAIELVCLSMMVGVPVLSLAPCFVQLLHLPITASSVGKSIALLTLALNVPALLHIRRPLIGKIKLSAAYELPFMLAILLLMVVSAWRCFYLPPTPRDMLTGPELLAEYAVREKNMISSVFSVDLSTTNNYFKSPYITGLQIIYKLLVCPFGQVWNSIMSWSLTGWLYLLLRRRLHPMLAGMLLLFFITTPDLYAYTYLMLYDYSNMVLFFCGFYFLACYLKNNQFGYFVFSAVLFGLATYIRTETIVLAGLFLPLIVFHFYRQHLPAAKVAGRIGLFLLVPALFYVLCIHVFIAAFIPIHLDVAGQVNQHLGNVSVFFYRLRDMSKILIFSQAGVTIYGYFIFFFLGLLATDLLWPRRFTKEGLLALYGIAVVYVGLAFLGYLIPLVDLMNTTKRGMFKILPLMVLYIANSGLLKWFSAKISAWTEYV